MTRKLKKGGLVNIAPGNGGGALPDVLAGDEGLSTRQAARVLGVSVKTLENARWKGVGVTYRKVGKKVSYSIRDLRAYLDANTIQPRG